MHITFILKIETCALVMLNGCHVPQENEINYLNIHLDRHLTGEKLICDGPILQLIN